MKTFGSLATHYAQPVTSVCQCLKITLEDGRLIRITNLDIPVIVNTAGGETYVPSGMEISNIGSSAGLAVDNLELTLLPDLGGLILRLDLQTGKWNNALFELFEVNWLEVANPKDKNILLTGRLGEVKIFRGKYVIELRGLGQYLQQTIVAVTSKTCRYALGDVRYTISGVPIAVPRSHCRLSLTGFTFTGTFTSVTSTSVMTDTTKVQAAAYFTEGLLKITSGPSNGYSSKIKTHAGGGVFTLLNPMPFLPIAGNAFTVIAGCDKLRATCITKFNNILNFGGEPDLPGLDKLMKNQSPGV